MEEKYRSAIILKTGRVVSKSGTRDEVETFVLKNMDNMKKCRTVNTKTEKIDQELTIIN